MTRKGDYHMIEIANIENSPIVEFRVNGKLTKADVQAIDDFFETKVSDDKSVNMLLLMENWEGLTFKGLLEDFKLIKHVDKMNKIAIVGDSKFLKEDAKLEDLYPGISIVYFETDKETAKKWLEE